MATATTTIKIDGLRELAQAYRELPLALERRVLRKAVYRSALVIKLDAIQRAPVDTGRLQQAILIKRSEVVDPMRAVYIVTVRHGAKGTIKHMGGVPVDLDAYYWPFQEFGTAKMAAHPFMRPAFESNKELALGILIDNLADGVQLEAKALAWSNSL